MTLPTCRRCGSALEYVNVTNLGDLEPRYLATSTCDCPSSRCPLCHARLGESRVVREDECPTLTCCLFGEVVPVPEWA